MRTQIAGSNEMVGSAVTSHQHTEYVGITNQKGDAA
jgi:hypothetical protein